MKSFLDASHINLKDHPDEPENVQFVMQFKIHGNLSHELRPFIG